MLNAFGHRCVVAIRSTMQVEDKLNRIVNDGEEPGDTVDFLITAQVGVIKEAAELMGLSSTVIRCDRLLTVVEFTKLPKIRQHIEEIRVQFEDDLRSKHFLHVDKDLVPLWDRSDLFGQDVSAKFKAASSDIQSAGNCLALGQGTACVFHLMRAMEIAVRTLSKRLNVTITPQTTWRQMTGQMDDKIRKMSDKTERLKRKKNDWEGARANLHHVGSVWRNNTMHPATSYTPSQAKDVFSAVRVFMADLARL